MAWLAVLLGLGLLGASSARSETSHEPPLVIWLSLDGVRHDALEQGHFPALARIARQGLRAERLKPVFPSNTFPNHVSQATCAHPDRHGIVGNRFIDAEQGRFDYSNRADWMRAEPIWVTAERQGVRAATFFWVGSETDWRGQGASFRMRPFDRDVPESAKVDQILAWVELPEAERPGLIASWWRGTDRTAHRLGPEHPDVFEQLAQQDAELSRLLAGLDARDAWASTTLFVSSDHGMTTASQPVDPDAVLAAAGIDAVVVRGATLAHVWLAEGESVERAVAAFTARPELTVYRRGALPAALRLQVAGRTGDLVVRVDPPYYFERGGVVAGLWDRVAPLLGYRKGVHGYDPDHPDMGGIFLALGRGVPAASQLGAVSNLDLAPTVSALLGIDPPAQCEGKPLALIAPHASN